MTLPLFLSPANEPQTFAPAAKLFTPPAPRQVAPVGQDPAEELLERAVLTAVESALWFSANGRPDLAKAYRLLARSYRRALLAVAGAPGPGSAA